MLLGIVTVASVLALAAAVVVGLAAGRTAGHSASRWPHRLRWLAGAAAAVAAALLAPATARDSGWFAIVLLGVPVGLAALPVGWVLIAGRAAAAVDWLAAVLAMGWAVLLALGVGLAFLPGALLQLAAAATATAAGAYAPVEPAE